MVEMVSSAVGACRSPAPDLDEARSSGEGPLDDERAATALETMGAAVQAAARETPDDGSGAGSVDSDPGAKSERAEHGEKAGIGPQAKGEAAERAMQGVLASLKTLQDSLAELQNYLQLNGAASPHYSYLIPAIYWPAPLTPGIWLETSHGSLVLQLDRAGVAPNQVSAAFALLLSTTVAALMSQLGAGPKHE